MFTPILPAPTTHASGQHQYGTRIRSNSAIKPSVRLRQSPDAPQTQRRPKSSNARKNREPSVAGPSTAPPEYPPFPPPNVVLHPEDAGNKVFLALGRALVSINNHAITVKDLAELAMKFGLMCQNASAAGQAIATFIRNHYTRCNEQDDQPLLLKHHMSGTIYDDDLAPALYSRVGGAHCTSNNTAQDRLTNFRRGTQVWYLSKAAGAPCPFAAAGIRICDYNEDGKVGAVLNPGRERKRERDRLRKAAQTCGQKRKRLPRSCADKEDSASDSSDAEDERPPKVKLTLRLRPCLTSSSGESSSNFVRSTSRSESPEAEEDADLDSDSASDSDSDSDAMSVQEDEEDPTQSGNASSLGVHSTDAPIRKFSLPTALPPPPPGFPASSECYLRSVSLTHSDLSGSPPPDSEVEDDDYHITMTDARRLYSRSCASSDDEDSAWDGDFFGDLDADAETQWDSPGPRSPSVQIEDEVSVKQEPTDVRGLLDAWENLESQATELKVLNIVAQAAAAERELQEQATSDDLLTWTWPGTQPADADHIKQEDVEPNLLCDNDFMPPSDSLSPIAVYDPYDSPVEECQIKSTGSGSPAYEWQWRDVEILGPDSVKTRDLDDGVWHEYRARPSSPDEQVRSVSPEPRIAAAASSSASPTFPRAPLPRLDVQSADAGTSIAQARNTSITSPSLLASLTSLSIQTPAAPAFRSRSESTPVTSVWPGAAFASTSSHGESMAVHTVAPFEPAISAIQFEGVPVYQVALGTSTLLRRIDTGFVNISPIAQYFRKTLPSASGSVIVNRGSPHVCGTWVPLTVARRLVEDEPTLSTFLSDELRSLFPDAINALCPAVEPKTPCADYGHQFKSASEARRRSMTSHRLELPPREFEVSWEDHLATHPPFILATSAIDGHQPIPGEAPPIVEALSPTEEEMFHVLCADPEWDADGAPTEETVQNAEDGPAAPPSPPLPPTTSRDLDAAEAAHDRPLRRSKRVANAITTRSRTRSSKRGSRTSLS
ncbi:hypothetical protein BN946_scf184798.g50 [Trametes cinnabarina]|uniref:HTH APSES-type domain-containing protein n=1 Tax=Pycnoporus cinnabarinus TaxID=5643 RepID=A0A060S8Q7_PYCCI|nr:hypothetical protein BN946_scf184798.g50 [Trametes cinnabarina]